MSSLDSYKFTYIDIDTFEKNPSVIDEFDKMKSSQTQLQATTNQNVQTNIYNENNSYTVLCKKEYKKLLPNACNIALLLMCKNEHKRLKITLDSVTGFVDAFIIYDTGSVDDTIDIIKNHCEQHKINLYLCQGEFVNFSVSRNVSLDFADTIDNISYLLLLDTNDELRGGNRLREVCKKTLNTVTTGFLVCQEWFVGHTSDYYFNTRLVKARTGWRYKGSVHEYMDNSSNKAPLLRLGNDIILYQDRTQDDDKSGKRFTRDKTLLLKDYESDPKNGRTLFYLAQTLGCLNELEESLKYYTLRQEVDDFLEEKFHAFLRSGDIKFKLNHPWNEILPLYIRAFEIFPRAEPLVKIADYYRLQKNNLLSYMFANLAIQLPFPNQCILFIDKWVYDYLRWHIFSVVAYYTGHIREGRDACVKALSVSKNQDLDRSNLALYEQKIAEMQSSPSITSSNVTSSFETNISPTSLTEMQQQLYTNNNNNNNINQHQQVETKTQFINRMIFDLAKMHPGMAKKQLMTKANRLWKERHKK
jgi:hypothetical protein